MDRHVANDVNKTGMPQDGYLLRDSPGDWSVKDSKSSPNTKQRHYSTCREGKNLPSSAHSDDVAGSQSPGV